MPVLGHCPCAAVGVFAALGCTDAASLSSSCFCAAQAVLYLIFPAVLLGAGVAWLRLQRVKHITGKVQQAYAELGVDLSLASRGASRTGPLATPRSAGAGVRPKTAGGAGGRSLAAGATVISMMNELKLVYRWRDVSSGVVGVQRDASMG